MIAIRSERGQQECSGLGIYFGVNMHIPERAAVDSRVPAVALAMSRSDPRASIARCTKRSQCLLITAPAILFVVYLVRVRHLHDAHNCVSARPAAAANGRGLGRRVDRSRIPSRYPREYLDPPLF